MKALSLTLMFAIVADAAAQSPAFDVASIKAVNPNSTVMAGIRHTPTRLTLEGTLRYFIEVAYDVEDFQITSGPSWTGSERFAIDARVERASSWEEMRLMLRSLLAERCGLAIVRADRETTGFILTVAKSGSKMQAVSGPPRGTSTGADMARGDFKMPTLTKFLSSVLERLVEDRTGLEGIYSISLKWTPDDGSATDPSAGSIFAAIQEQLGLKLQSARIATSAIEITRVRRPSDN